MTVTAIGDIHLEKLDHRINNFTPMVLTALRATIKAALLRGTSAFVLVGDIFDSAHPSQTNIARFLDVLTDFDVPFYIPLGNHDFADKLTHSLVLTKWARKLNGNLRVVTKPKLIRVDGATYQIQPHPYVQDMSPKADFAFAHFAVNGARGENGFTVRTNHQPKGNFVLGDFHEAQEGKIKKCIYEYVGSLTQLSWEESTKKSVLSIEDGEKVRHKVDLPYKLIKYTVGSNEELEKCKFEPNCYYYMKTKDGYVLPPGWSLEHPEVVRQASVGKKVDKRAAVLAPEETFVHPLANLEPYLLSKKVDGSVVKRAVELAEKINIKAA
ncbi:DNA repair exonuclease subunit 1 protein [Rhizobium phage RHEph12]|nr:DNA repair exonuclease subunit 1 protein [Rhizobium phage RHEph12]